MPHAHSARDRGGGDFWVCAPLAVLGALGLVFSRKPVYSALSMAVSMISLAVLYASLDAPFLFVDDRSSCTPARS
jgi:hypothetical protein